MTSHESGRIAETLVQRAAEGADVGQIADAIVSIWQQINVALSPIIGQGTVAVLYIRSLHLINATHPWLERPLDEPHTAMNLPALKAALSQRSAVEAATTGGTLFQTFYELLASLIGPSLTEQLLRSVWANPLSGPPAQDTSP